MALFCSVPAIAQSVVLQPGASVRVPATDTVVEPDLRGVLVLQESERFTITDSNGAVLCTGYVDSRFTRSSAIHMIDEHYQIRTTGGSGAIAWIYFRRPFEHRILVSYYAPSLGVRPTIARRITQTSPTIPGRLVFDFRSISRRRPEGTLLRPTSLLNCSQHRNSRLLVVRTESTATDFLDRDFLWINDLSGNSTTVFVHVPWPNP